MKAAMTNVTRSEYADQEVVAERTEERAVSATGDTAACDLVQAMLYCPVCSCRLHEHRCKLNCPRCGYYMSCSDYY